MFKNIKNLPRRMPVLGLIKIGDKGPAVTSQKGNNYRQPRKLNHFIVTTTDRGDDENFIKNQAIHKIIGDEPTTLKVRLLFNDIDLNFRSQYASWDGKFLSCHGDGETGESTPKNGSPSQCTCPCARQDPKYTGLLPCKITSELSVILDAAPVFGGIWKLKTTGWNTTVGLYNSLEMLYAATRGHIMGVPLVLKLSPKSATNPKTGAPVQIFVVNLFFNGPPQELMTLAVEHAKQSQLFHSEMARIGEQIKLLGSPMIMEDDDLEEFYPEGDEKDVVDNHQKTVRRCDIESVMADNEPTDRSPSKPLPTINPMAKTTDNPGQDGKTNGKKHSQPEPNERVINPGTLQ